MTTAEATTSGQLDQYNSLVNKTLAGTVNINGTTNPAIPPTSVNTAINATDISKNQSPIVIPPQNTTPTTNNLALANNTSAANATTVSAAPAPAPVPPATNDKAGLKSYLDQILGKVSTQGTDEAAIQNDQNLLDKKSKATTLSNELTAMDKAYRDEVASIKQNTQGGFGGSIQAETNKATDRYQNNRANASIAYNTALGDYQAAQDLVTQKVTALETNNKNLLNTYSLLKDSVYNDLTESEKMTIQNNQKTLDARLKMMTDTYSNVLETASKNGASAAVLSAIDTAAHNPNSTPADIYKAAGTYIVKPGTTGTVAIGGKEIPTLNGKSLTDAQAQSVGYAQRLTDANSIISDIGGKFTGVLNSVSGSSYFPNILKSADRQSFEQAQRNFVNAVLRKESGAAISPSEFANAAQQYFPQPGDSQQVIDQKTQNRNRTIENLAISANVPASAFGGSSSAAPAVSSADEAYIKSLNLK